MTNQEIVAITTVKYRSLLKKYTKADSSLIASLISLCSDVFETFGMEYNVDQLKAEINPKKLGIDSEDNTDLNKKIKELETRLQLKSQSESWKVLESRITDAVMKDGWVSPAYVPSVTFDQPSPGVVVPAGLEGDEKIAWLMENDPTFRRGRLNWLKKQENYRKNLITREKNKEKRRLAQLEKEKSRKPTREGEKKVKRRSKEGQK